MRREAGSHVIFILEPTLTQPTGAEVAILQAEIEIVGDRITSAGNQLPGKAAVLDRALADGDLIEGNALMGVVIADPAAAVDGQPRGEIGIEQAIEHQRQDSSAAVGPYVEVIKGDLWPNSDVVVANVIRAVLGTLVAKLTFEPKETEIVTRDRVDIEPALVVDVDVVERRAHRGGGDLFILRK